MNKYIVACSGGNDSIALIQYMLDKKKDFCVVYNDTGWARDDWPERIKKVSEWLFNLGIVFHITKSEGMEALVKRKKGWPMPASAMQFCTQELKEKPSIELYQKLDPQKIQLTYTASVEYLQPFDATYENIVKIKKILKENERRIFMEDNESDFCVVTGRRREESQNRRDLPINEFNSLKHGGRDVFNPLASYDKKMRNDLINKTPFTVLPHSSKECDPCVCENKNGLSELTEKTIVKVENIEINMGHTRNDKPRTMFRPYRVGGGVGIRQAVAWGRGERGFKSHYIPNEYKLKGEQCVMFEGVSDVAYEIETKEGREFARQCDGGYCGS